MHSVNHNVVFKASGLAAGKGVIIAETQEEVLAALKEFTVDRALGDAGNEVVIEGFLDGQGISILTISDRVTFKSMPLPRTTREFLMATNTKYGGHGILCTNEYRPFGCAARYRQRHSRANLQGLTTGR